MVGSPSTACKDVIVVVSSPVVMVVSSPQEVVVVVDISWVVEETCWGRFLWFLVGS